MENTITFLKKYRVFFIFSGLFSFIVLYLFYMALKPERKLPIFQPAMVNYELVDSSLQHIKKYHKIAPFTMINQNGAIVTEKTYKDKIYVADFFFTTCPGICLIMTDNMSLLQEKIINDSQVMLLSFSVTPKIDSVQRLKKYAVEKGVIDTKWNLVTGNKEDIYKLARKSYLAVKDNFDGGPYDMIHTENFVLVDPDKRIRGFYNGTKQNEMKTLLSDIKVLKQEYKLP